MADEHEQSITPELVNEQLLIEQLGIPIKKIRALRPEAAQVQSGVGVFWPMADAQALASHLGLHSFGPQEKTAPPPGVETLVVVSLARGVDGRHFPNKNVINAARLTGDVVQVRVVDSAKYRRTLRIGGTPMLLQARRADSGNWWVLVGREPRWPGQW